MIDRGMIDAFASELIARLGEGRGLDLPIAPDARITADGYPAAIEDSLIGRATGLGDVRILATDADSNQIGLFALVERGEQASVCGLRLRVADGRAVEVETVAGPPRFPSTGGVDAREAEPPRAAFARPPATPGDREAMRHAASLYYAAVVREEPGIAPLDPAGARTEVGTRITDNPAFAFDFYAAIDGGELPNFGEWSARDQFLRGLWNADGVTDERYPVVDRARGIVLACTSYRPWHKRFETDVAGVGRVGPRVTGRRVALNMMEMFRIEAGTILEMESVWTIEPAEFASPWA